MSSRAEVVSVNLSEETGTIKYPVESIEIDAGGVVGDAHSGPWHRQISLLSQELIDEFIRMSGRETVAGEFAENITTAGLDLSEIRLLDRIRIGDVDLQVTQIGKECHGSSCAIFREVGACIMPKNGLFVRVMHGGTVKPGDSLVLEPKTLAIRVITLSDRAFAGQYEDRSGPRVKELLEQFFADREWHLDVSVSVLPDEADQLREALTDARDAGVDIVLTTGSTGIGPRDIAPEVAAEICDRLVPGIVEHIRTKYGAEKPGALLSRSIAGVAGGMFVCTLPGSVKAVNEYVAEIVKNLEHILFMLHGIDRHQHTPPKSMQQ